MFDERGDVICVVECRCLLLRRLEMVLVGCMGSVFWLRKRIGQCRRMWSEVSVSPQKRQFGND